MRSLLLIGLVSCVPVPGSYARVAMKPNHELAGTRAVTIVGDDENMLNTFEGILERYGFRVSRELPSVRTALASRYLLRVDGGCYRGMYRVGDLNVIAYDATTNERLLRANLIDNDWCPRVFFEDVASELSRVWIDRPTSPPEPKPHSDKWWDNISPSPGSVPVSR